MNFISNILKTIMAGLAMQHAADNLPNNEKLTLINKAVEHKQRASESETKQEAGKTRIDTDSVVLNQG